MLFILYYVQIFYCDETNFIRLNGRLIMFAGHILLYVLMFCLI